MNASEITGADLVPTSFPYDEDEKLFTFEGYPNALSNGHLLEVSVAGKDKKLLAKAVSNHSKDHLSSFLHFLGDNNTLPIPEPQIAEVRRDIVMYVFTHPRTQAQLGIPLRHWNYMRYRYPNCVFFFGRCEHAEIVVRDSKDIVGIIAPFNPVTRQTQEPELSSEL